MRVILVDDERLALDYLERQLMKLADIEIVGKYSDPIVGRKEILQARVDVLFLDISLPEINGIELAEQILETKPDINVVFVTAYNEYAVKAFELNALDYIVKPIRIERLTKTVDRVRERLEIKQEYTTAANQGIKMNLFRQVSVEIGSGSSTILQWRTTKAQELFLYLLQYRDQLVRKTTLIDLLWPEYESDKVYSQLYTSVYHIRKTLKPYGDHFQIMNTTEGYILNIHQVCLDIENWETKLNDLPPISNETVDEYVESIKLYTGDYLQEYDYWWAESERQRLKALWLNTSMEIADWYLEQGLLDKAVMSYQQICSLHPQEETPHFALMKVCAMQHNDVMVHRLYRELSEVLLNELSVEPNQEISDWYRDWCEKAGSKV